MEKILSYEQYLYIIKPYINNAKFKNVFFLKQQITNMIDGERLFYAIKEQGLFLFEKCEGFYRSYYYVMDDTKCSIIKEDLPIVIEFVFDINNPKSQNEREYLCNIGFELKRKSRRMVLSDIKEFKDFDFRIKGVDTRFAEPRDILDVRNMLLSNFNPLYSYLPTEKEMLPIILSKRIIVAVYQDEIIGVIHFEQTGKTLMMHQLAVRPKFKGVGWLLFRIPHQIYKDMIKNCKMWVDEKNTAACKMYEKAGYNYDNRCADEYVQMSYS